MSEGQIKLPDILYSKAQPALILFSFVLANYLAGCASGPLPSRGEKAISATSIALAQNPTEAAEELQELPSVLTDRAVRLSFRNIVSTQGPMGTVNYNFGSGIVWLETDSQAVILTVAHILPEEFSGTTLDVSQPQKRQLNQFSLSRNYTSDNYALYTIEGNPLALIVVSKTNYPDPVLNNITSHGARPPAIASADDLVDNTLLSLSFPMASDTGDGWFRADLYSGGKNTSIIDGDNVIVMIGLVSGASSGGPVTTGNGAFVGLIESGDKKGFVAGIIPVAGQYFNTYLAPLLTQAGISYP